MKSALIIAAAAFALTLALFGMTGPDDIEAAQDLADYKAALPDGGVAMCKEFGRVPTWTKAGDLVCRAVQGGQP